MSNFSNSRYVRHIHSRIANGLNKNQLCLVIDSFGELFCLCGIN
jgi:hypothetical protein